MLYSIVDKAKAEEHRINPVLHRHTSDGKRICVNENELRLVDENIEAAAALLGGTLLTSYQAQDELRKK